MQTVTYKSVRDAAAKLDGVPPSELGTADKLRIGEFVDEAARLGSNNFWWPELMKSQRRLYRAAYVDATAYVATKEVYFYASDKYYQALKSTTGKPPATGSPLAENSAFWAALATSYSGNDYDNSIAYATGDRVKYLSDGEYYQCHTASAGNFPTNASFWGKLTPFIRYVGYEQTGEEKLGSIRYVTDKDLLIFLDYTMYEFKLDTLGAVITGTAPNRPYLYFKTRPSRFSGDDYSATADYVAGDFVYYGTTGECYENIFACTGVVPTDKTKWTKQDMPIFLAQFCSHWAYGSLEGSRMQNEAEEAAKEDAWDLLMVEKDLIVRAQRQQPMTILRRTA